MITFLLYLLNSLGRWVIQYSHAFFSALQLTLVILRRGHIYQRQHRKNKLIKHAITAQIIFSGIDTLFPTLFILSIFIGFGVTAQLILFLQTFSNEQEVIRLLTEFIALQLSPTLTAIILIARSGLAITVDIGNMYVNYETKGLALLGVDPYIYLAYPRIIGLAISQMALAVYFATLSMLFGIFFAGLLGSPSNFKYFFIIIDSFNNQELFLFLLKNLLSGAAIAGYACYFAFNIQSSITEVPQATQKSIVHSLIAVFMINTVFAMV